MNEVAVATTMGSSAALSESAVAELRGSLLGPVLQFGDSEYEDARRVWNGMTDKHPALIARCQGAADVLGAVKFARANDLLVAVRGGGHSIAGHSVCEGGFMIDLSRMNGV